MRKGLVRRLGEERPREKAGGWGQEPTKDDGDVKLPLHAEWAARRREGKRRWEVGSGKSKEWRLEI